MIVPMSLRILFLASVSAAFLAASAAVSGPAAAATPNANTQLASEAYKALAAGDAAAAVESYSKAIESRQLEPEVLANALLNRGLAYQHLNQHNQAIDDYTSAMRIDAMSGKLRAMALYNRGLSYQRLQQPARAMDDFTSALFLDQTFAYAYYSRGNLLRDTGQYLFALADFEKALQFAYPDTARAYFGEALAYEKLERPGNARDALTKALAANPQFQPAKIRLAALDGAAKPVAATGFSDQIVTASIADGSQVSRKLALPVATAPAASLLAADSTQTAGAGGTTPRAKIITDRVPAEQQVIITAAADQSADAAPATEKIVAIEPMPDTATASDTPDDQQASTTDAASGTAAVSAETLTGWSVQIASATSEDAAWSTWKKMQSSHGVLAGKKPVVVKADLGTKGTFFRVRLTGFDKQSDAKSVCSKLKSGGVTCFISKAST